MFPSIAGLALIGGGGFWLYRRSRRKQDEASTAYGPISGAPIDESKFDFAFLKASDIELGEKLGEGSFGTVYKGVFNGKQVAVKVSRPGMQEALEDFLREAGSHDAHPAASERLAVGWCRFEPWFCSCRVGICRRWLA